MDESTTQRDIEECYRRMERIKLFLSMEEQRMRSKLSNLNDVQMADSQKKINSLKDYLDRLEKDIEDLKRGIESIM